VVLVPYSTWSVDAWFVVQVIVAEVLLILVAMTDEIMGAVGVPADVVKVKFGDTACWPPEFVDMAA
jgi:hypothetical protein